MSTLDFTTSNLSGNKIESLLADTANFTAALGSLLSYF